jgi:hypothetical protein
MTIGTYSIGDYQCLLMIILLMAISNYSIMVVLLMAIGGYSINGH